MERKALRFVISKTIQSSTNAPRKA
ncbi:hypothetical protein CCACVL1_03298 [Corchorus capsularis]|uniref:Uncharacterized protein n=1 Tax=Corchorus capsularis TaxID=210143 RepID=A0A1R3K0Z0_COCAP|nr:hypothetical protein CCACVL1_03298 [Corchorus capsularis]